MRSNKWTLRLSKVILSQLDRYYQIQKKDPSSRKELVALLDSHSAKMNEAHKFNNVSGKFDDTDFAKLHLRYKSLFYHYDSFTPDLKFLVGAATFYFIEQEDEIPDMDPFFGLDDDAEVLEEVLRVIKELT